MSVVIVSLPNVYVEEDYQMPSADWLDLPRLRGEKNVHGDKASDGYRIHYAKTADGDCGCGGDTCPQISALTKKIQEEPEYLLSVNRRFLIEALAGIESVDGYVHLFRASVEKAASADGQKFNNPMALVLSDGESRLAVIMPLAIVTPPILAIEQPAPAEAA